MKHKSNSIGKAAAIELAKSNWWKDKSAKDITFFQFFTAELCMPFSEFHEALEKTLGRPVFTHELGMNYDEIAKELLGHTKAPTLQEVLDLIPEHKQLVVV